MLERLRDQLRALNAAREIGLALRTATRRLSREELLELEAYVTGVIRILTPYLPNDTARATAHGWIAAKPGWLRELVGGAL